MLGQAGDKEGDQGGGQAESDGHVSSVSEISPGIRAVVYRILTSMGQEVKTHDGAETSEE